MGAPTLQPYLASRRPLYADQQSRQQAGNPLWNTYRARDKWLFLCLPNTDESWTRLCGSLEREGLADDPRFASPQLRTENRADLIALLGDVLAGRSAQDWMDRWKPLGVTASPIQNLKEVSEDPQAWANDYFLKTHCAEVDREVDIRGLPIGLSKTPGSVESLGPELGQDTELILMDTLEMEWDQIEELKADGVIP